MTNTTTQYTSCALRTRDKGGRGHKLEIRKDDVSNALTQVTKDYLVLECTSNEKEMGALPIAKRIEMVGVGHHPFSKKKEFKGYFDEPAPCLIATDYKAPKTVLELHYDDGMDDSCNMEETKMTNTTTQPVQQTPFNYIELFAGIGGFRQALDPIGGNCVFASEIDRFATQAYKALYGGEDAHLHGDITKIDAVDVPDHDVLVGGFPCQAFSVAGKREGFADKTRGTLFFDIVRIMAEKQPKLALLENVKGLVGHDGGKTLDTVVESLNAIGYHVDFNVMNSKYFGVPQNRERIFIVALRDDLAQTADWVIEGTNVVAKGKKRIAGYGDAKMFNFDWPAQGDVTTRLRDVLEPSVDEKYYLSEEKTAALVAQLEAKDTVIGSVGHHPFSKKFEFNGFNSDISPTLLATDYKAPKTVLEGLPIREATKQGYAVASEGDAVNFQFPESKTRRGRVGKEIANTLEASGINQGVVEQIGVEYSRKTGVGKPLDVAHCLSASDWRGLNRNQAQSAVVEVETLGNVNPSDGEGVKAAQAEALELAKGFMDGAEPTIDVIGTTLDTGAKGTNFRSWVYEADEGLVGTVSATIYKQPTQIFGKSTRYRIRKLTPLECFRLQGFPDDAHRTLVDAGISDSQRYKQAGNAVTVNVISALADRLMPLIGVLVATGE